MSVRHDGPWHYERIRGRDNGREWRVADRDDDPITDFVTEKEAKAYVRIHNENLRPDPAAWKK